VAGGFCQYLLRAVAPRDVGEEQFSDLGVPRQPGRGSGGQMPTRAGERHVSFEEGCLDHQRVGATHRLDEAGDLLGVADDGERGAGNGCAVHHFGHDIAAVGQHDRAALREQSALRPRRYAERIEALGYKRVPGLVLKPIPEALGPAMRHRKGVETPTLSHQDRPRRNRAQPVTTIALRPDRVGEVAPDECQRLAASDDLDRPLHPIESKGGEEACQPQYVIEMMNKITHGEAIISTGVGQHQMWAAQYLDFTQPRSFLTSGSMGTMGFGLPAAIGAQLANPGRLVIDVDGDGSIRMNLGELETLTTYDIPVKVLLLNNMGDGMVRQWQDLFYANRYSGSDKTLHKKDFVRAAEADGFGFARRVTAIADVRPGLEDFVGYDGPAFLEVMVDQNAHVYPMVAPGMGYRDMITGKWIKSREQKPPSSEEPTGYF